MEQGLTNQQVVELQKQYGANEISTKESFSVIKLFFSQFPTLINGILFIAALFSFFINEPLDAILIVIILLLNALLGFFQEFRAEKALEKLKSLTEPVCTTLRDGKTIAIAAKELVPGDIVILNEGDRLPADGIIQTQVHCEIDESVLTGESVPVIKQHGDEAFRGTFIAKGKGHLLVTAIGNQTKLGKIAQTLTSVETEPTPLQKQMDRLTKYLSFGAIGLALLLLPIGIFEGKELYPLFLLTISIGVAAIPESLPAIITIALSLGTNRMAKKNAIVRKLSSIETIGAVQVVLTDKTGTLTQNNMRVKEAIVVDLKLNNLLIHACLVGNTAHIVEENDKKDVIGDKTDGALLLWAEEQIDLNVIPASCEARSGSARKAGISHGKLSGSRIKSGMTENILDEFTFDTTTKTITIVAQYDAKPHVFVRGAPESILAMSKVSQSEKEKLTQQYESFAEKGLRVIAIAYKHEPNHKKLSRKELETNLTFLGFMCIYDPPRAEAKEAVHTAQQAGIRVIMVTGDNSLTAKAIAEEVGILDGEKTIITGKEMQSMSDEELQETIKHVSVFARTAPEDKMRLVQLFQSQGLVVGVTGDGVNDALALKKANVGLSMGQKGTDVAKEASDIVLADDNFATLVAAVAEGRKIYANIVNAITYLITGNLSELLLILFATFVHMPFPLLPTQILWINLVTDGLPALALVNDTGGKKLLEKKPRNKEQPLITKNRLVFIIVGGAITAIVNLWIFNVTLNHYTLDQARTLVFGLVVISQIIIAILIRGRQFFSNKIFYLSLLINILLQMIITFTPFFQQIFHLST
jgi:Ca2+-transporting ATPase